MILHRSPSAAPTALVRHGVALLRVFRNCTIVLFLRSEIMCLTESDNCRSEANFDIFKAKSSYVSSNI